MAVATHPILEIRPGEAIGPFALGMTRDQARGAARRAFDAEARAWDGARPERADFVADLGIVVFYEPDGRCGSVDARFGYAFGNKCELLLLGERINAMRDDEIVRLCQTRWRDVELMGYGYDVPSAGLRLAYYDTRSDGCFCLASVFPAAPGA